MKRLLSFVFVAVVAAIGANRSDAGYFVTTDLDSSLAGVQSSNPVPLLVGQEITATFYLQNTDTSTLAAYNFSVQFGTSFEYVSRSESPYGTAPNSLTEFDTTNVVLNNIATRYDGGTTSTGITVPTGPSAIGTLVLRYIGGTSTGITPGLFEPAFDQSFDTGGNDITSSIVFTGGTASVVAVPEPASMAVLTVAGISGWYARRRAARKHAVK